MLRLIALRPLAALLACVAASFVAPLAIELSAEPLTPPGVTQPLTPPAPEPKLAPAVEPIPEPEPHPIPFSIVATTNGDVIADEPIVVVQPGEMLRLTLTGGGVEPYSLDVRQRKVRWTLSQPTKNWAEVYEGHFVTFCHPTGGAVFLATATINNPDPLEAPFVAMRWVTIGGAPVVTPVDPDKPAPVDPLPTTDKATAATYVYEKDDGAPPPGVLAGLDRLNREKKITASAVDIDVVDGDGETPDQFKVAFAAARDAGLPVLIVTAGNKVICTVAKPKTEAETWGAVP